MIEAVGSIRCHPGPGGRATILHVTGTLRAPAHTVLARRVEARLARGERRLVLDLGGLSEIDAAGLGELVRAFNRTAAAGGVLEITRANRRIRALLDATCLSAVLTSAQRAHAP